MPIQDVFSITGRGVVITGRGVVITGRIETGQIEIGDAVFITGGAAVLPSRVIAIEMMSPSYTAWAGDNVGILLRSVEASYITPGMMIIKQDEA
jgi:elongation factor Tu